jgi:hypothetical protein
LWQNGEINLKALLVIILPIMLSMTVSVVVAERNPNGEHRVASEQQSLITQP